MKKILLIIITGLSLQSYADCSNPFDCILSGVGSVLEELELKPKKQEIDTNEVWKDYSSKNNQSNSLSVANSSYSPSNKKITNFREFEKYAKNSKKMMEEGVITKYQHYSDVYEKLQYVNFTNPNLKVLYMKVTSKLVNASDDLELGKITKREFDRIRRNAQLEFAEKRNNIGSSKVMGNQEDIVRTYSEAEKYCDQVARQQILAENQMRQQQTNQDIARMQQNRMMNQIFTPTYNNNINCNTFGSYTNCYGSSAPQQNFFNGGMAPADLMAQSSSYLADAFNDMFTKGSKMKACMKEQGYEYKN